MDATQELLRLGNRQAELVSSIGDVATMPVEEVAAHHELATAELAAAVEAGTKVKALIVEIETAEADKAAIANRRSEIDLELAGIEPQISAAVVQRDALRAEVGELAASWDADPQKAIDALDVIAAALNQVERCIANCREASQTVTKTQAMAKASASTLAEALAACPFTSVDEAQAVALDPEELARLEATIVDFDTRDTANQTLLSENLKLELPEVRPDATELDVSAQSARTAAEKASEAVSQIAGHLDFAKSNLTAARTINEGSEAAFERSNSLQTLAKTCDGQGPKRIALETWVLAGELERVAAAANHHLQKMTNGRYRIERSDDSGHGGRQSGLDLRVLDAHTGASRRPGSLSGGEQFQASLALALGLADVIGHGGNANGRVFEALFVDEGFGSLDPDSLDQAVDALTHIQASGRTVGVITHVEAMKENLAMGIRVDRLPNGKGSTLTVRPNG
jgi:exonuclease SbcC